MVESERSGELEFEFDDDFESDGDFDDAPDPSLKPDPDDESEFEDESESEDESDDDPKPDLESESDVESGSELESESESEKLIILVSLVPHTEHVRVSSSSPATLALSDFIQASHLCAVFSTFSCAFIIALHTLQWEPSVSPSLVHVASTAASLTAV